MALSNDLSDLKVTHLVNANSHAVGTVNGTSMLVTAYDEVVYILNVGAGGAGATIDFKLQESDDNSTWTDVPSGALAQVARDAGGQSQTFHIVVRCDSRKAYLRHVHVIGGAAFNFSLTAVATVNRTEDSSVAALTVA